MMTNGVIKNTGVESGLQCLTVDVPLHLSVPMNKPSNHHYTVPYMLKLILILGNHKMLKLMMIIISSHSRKPMQQILLGSGVKGRPPE